MYKKIVINQVGAPEVLKVVEYTLNENMLRPHEIRIKHLSIGVNFIDTYHRSGLYPAKLPITPGLEAVGEVVMVGNKVKRFRVGDRVGYCAPPLGAYSEVRDFPEEKAFLIPKEISSDDAASILLKGMTVEYLFNRTYKIKPGDTVLFHAAAGGVGLIACQWARSIGCKLIGTVGNEEKEEVAKKNGCSHVINYTKEDVVKSVMEKTDGKGVAVVYDGVGKDTFDISIDCLSKRGLFVSFGNASGMTPVTDLFKSFHPKNLFFTRPSLMVYNESREELEKSSDTLFRMILEKKIQTLISQRYSLLDATRVHKDLESRKTFGSLIIKP
ncbi:MAG: Quinone oxidoreductase 1 [Alphaproteobacteria bacterium MarineAlpha5_Bin9]|nr:MAG: Quinone oxidoreductase 1 [Alphaproteobacteria bacterium MarineAlpha5_Bin9]|tara:strand:+ start:26066 stop:27046 length:981 start_codon:yes stop_codon:yes gene_type:complete